MRVSHAEQLISTYTSSNPVHHCQNLNPWCWKGWKLFSSRILPPRWDAHSSVGSLLPSEILPLGWDPPSPVESLLLCGMLIPLWDPPSPASQEQSKPDRTPQRSPGGTTFKTYPKVQRSFLAERIKALGYFQI